jgi:hypothetical protein
MWVWPTSTLHPASRTCLAPRLALLLTLLLLLMLLLAVLRSCWCFGSSGLWHRGHALLSPSSAAIIECLQVLQRTLGSSRSVRPDATHTCTGHMYMHGETSTQQTPQP